MKDVRLLVLCFISCFSAAGVGTQLTSAASGDPAKGKLIYETNCSTCHGARGKGDGLLSAALTPPPPDLTSPKAKAKSDQDLLTVIRDGRVVMPAWKSRLNEQDIQNVLAYIRSLNE
jgi:mono/diheme cytochrome c family protein